MKRFKIKCGERGKYYRSWVETVEAHIWRLDHQTGSLMLIKDGNCIKLYSQREWRSISED